jgi:DNA mismatch repair protein MutL
MDALTHVLAQGLGTSAWKGPLNRPASFWNERLPVGPLPHEAPERASELPSSGPVTEPDPWGLAPEPPGAAPNGRPSDAPSWTAPGALSALPYANARATTERSLELLADRAVPLAPASPFRALAQSQRLYIVAESERGLFVIDQHAADERIHYDRLKRQYAAGEVVQQRMLLPTRVELSEREAALVEAHGAAIARAGLEVSLIGSTSAVVHSVPALLRRAPPERLLRDLLAELNRSGERSFGDAIDMALATLACHGALRSGDELSLAECQALLEALARIDDFAGHCPHGRPIVFEIPFENLARKVGR